MNCLRSTPGKIQCMSLQKTQHVQPLELADHLLIEQACAGDRWAFEALVYRYQSKRLLTDPSATPVLHQKEFLWRSTAEACYFPHCLAGPLSGKTPSVLGAWYMLVMNRVGVR